MFKSILQTLSFLYETVSDRYETSIAKTDDELAAVYNLRKEIFGDELKRSSDEKKSPAKPDDLDDKSTHFICKDTTTGEIIGAVRVTYIAEATSNPDYIKEYGITHVPKNLQRRTIIISRLILKKEHRRTSATLNIFLTVGEYCFKNHIVLALVSCEPNLYPVYRKLGFIPLDKIHLSPFGGYRVPIVLVLHDRENYARIASPVLKTHDKFVNYTEAAGLDWQTARKEQGLFVDPGFAFFLEGDAKNEADGFVLTKGFSEKGISELMTNAIHIKCSVGDKVIAQDAGGRNMGIVVQGILEIRRKNRLIAMLGPGDIFGEIAFIIEQPRTADVIAATPDTEVVLLSASSLTRLSSQKDRELFWKNVSEVLAKRIVVQNARGNS